MSDVTDAEVCAAADFITQDWLERGWAIAVVQPSDHLAAAFAKSIRGALEASAKARTHQPKEIAA